MATLEFPDGFFWGAATASHKVEGGTENQWSEWERSPARLAALEKEGLIAKYGKENFISGKAADHYHRFEEDFALAKSLGHNATRISLQWSRIEPREGEFDAEEIEHYRRVVTSIRQERHGAVRHALALDVAAMVRRKRRFRAATQCPLFRPLRERMATGRCEILAHGQRTRDRHLK